MRSILVVQPNSSQAMTDALKPLIDSLQFEHVNQHRPRHECATTNHS